MCTSYYASIIHVTFIISKWKNHKAPWSWSEEALESKKSIHSVLTNHPNRTLLAARAAPRQFVLERRPPQDTPHAARMTFLLVAVAVCRQRLRAAYAERRKRHRATPGLELRADPSYRLANQRCAASWLRYVSVASATRIAITYSLNARCTANYASRPSGTPEKPTPGACSVGQKYHRVCAENWSPDPIQARLHPGVAPAVSATVTIKSTTPAGHPRLRSVNE
jgi:hypothetical protein